jgi:hypothetical protein
MVCGSVRWLAERYAEYYEAYPRVIGTGGDMGVLESDGACGDLPARPSVGGDPAGLRAAARVG